MGGGSSKSNRKTIKNPVENNWETVEQGQAYNIVRNRTDGREAQQYAYTLENRYDPSGEAIVFERRNKTSLPVVRTYDHQWEAKGSGLVPKNNFRVVTERIPHRLTTVPQLTFDESLYVLDRALEGYNFLYRAIGPFDVNSNMIGFTAEGQTRVWHNENFGRNYPYHEKRTLQSTRIDETHKYDNQYVPLEEIELVRNIVNVVEDRCEQGQFPEQFRDRIRQNIGFEDARRVVQQEWENTQERVKLNRIDLWKNLVRSKITKNHRSTLGQTNLTYNSNVPINQTTSYVYPANTYTEAYVPSNQPSKNAYSFSYQKTIPA